MPQTAESFLEEEQQSAEEFLDGAPSAEAFLGVAPRTRVEIGETATGIRLPPDSTGASVSRMAAATRATVGVVGRAISAFDFVGFGDTPTEEDLPAEKAVSELPDSDEAKRIMATKRIEEGLRESALATRQANLTGFGEGVARSMDIFGALNWVGKVVGGFTEDLLQGRVLPTGQRVSPDLAATGAAVVGVEDTAPPPQAALTPAQQGIIDGARGLPPIVAASLLAAGGVPPPAAFAIVMGGGTFRETGDPAQASKSAAIGAVLPGVGAATKQLAGRVVVEAVNKGLVSVGNTALQKSVEAAAELVGIAAFNEAMHLPDYATMTPEQRKEALQKAIGANLAFLPMIVPTVFGRGRTAKQERLMEVAPLTAEAVAKTESFGGTGNVVTGPESVVVGTPTPRTTEAVAKVAQKEPVLETPTPTPAAVAGESGTTPVAAGEPPAKVSVTPDVTLDKLESEQPLTTGRGVNSRLAADVPIAEPYSNKFSVSLQVTKINPSVSDASVIDSLPEGLRGQVDSVRRFIGEAVPTNKAMSIPGRIEIVFKDKASAQAAVDYFKAPIAIPGLPAPKWTSATKAGVDLGRQTLVGIPDPVATVKAVIALAKEASPYIKRAGEAVARAASSAKEGVGEFVGEQMKAQRMTDYRRSVLNWSSKLQQSFGEADSAQKEIRKAVPNAVRREGITNWIQADGDPTVLRARADATADPKLKAGYEAALKLTPEEIAVANDVRTAFAELGTRGQTYDVLNSFKENYVTQTWDLGRGPATGGSRSLKERFRFSKASTFATYFDGEQAGYVPKTKDIAKILPMYLHEMNSVIAARQLVQEMAGGVGSDGRPLLAARGGGIPVEGDGGKATLIMPKKVAKDTGDYKVIENQPALTGWRWAAKDTEGNPIFIKADLALHPEAYKELKKVLGTSAIKEWYNTRTSDAAQIPKMLVKGLDVGQAETKRTMLGFFAPFHQVQEGTHAVGHRVNPFRAKEGGLIDRATGGKLPEALKMPKIDLVNNAAQKDATRHGLMLLPDRTSADQFMEGFRHSGLVSMIPKIGPAADWYSHYLFQEYIPGLKFKTYENILKRNQDVYAKELASGAVKLEDIKVLSAEQSNAAYGHLNYADLGRNPTIQHGMQMFLLAPDFFEARGRFAAQGAKGITGAKVGREQILALATLAVTQATTAWIAAQVTGGTWDPKHPFEMVLGDRRYTMRSVPEDLAGLITDARRFFYSRLSPIIGKGIIQGTSGVDYKGDKVTAGDTAKELAQAPIPLPLRGFVGTSNRNLTAFEELAGSVGLRISRYLPEPVMHGIQLREEVDLWINRSKKLDTDEERAEYLNKQLAELSTEDRKKAVIRIKQRTSPGVRKRVR